MKPKYSTGYLTPQIKATKQVSKTGKPSGSKNVDSGRIESKMPQINDSIYEKIMSCPLKRKLVLSIIESEKDNIEEYKKKLAKKKGNENSASPLNKVQKKYQCESPTALLRRRALEQQNLNTPTGSKSDSPTNDSESSCGSRTSSRQSVAAHSPVPFDKLLTGVVAYVEIKSKDQDRSTGVKALTNSMGATIRDTFSRDVTHVIFKDGSFTTYQKANLMNIHIVSVLWLEACRSSGMKVSESKFPALGTDAYDHNVSSICSQMQKEYEDIIKEEYQRSILTGTPLPSTKALIDRRRTIMTPNVSTTHYSRNNFSQEFSSSQDTEIADILCRGRRTQNFSKTIHHDVEPSPEPTSDDGSDMVALIDGKIISTKTKNAQIADSSLGNQIGKTSDNSIIHDLIMNDSMDLTTLATEVNNISSKEKALPNTPDDIYNVKTPKIIGNKAKRTSSGKANSTKCKNLKSGKIHDQLACTSEVVSKKRTSNSTEKIESSNNNTKISDVASNDEMSSLKLSFSPKVQILSKNVSVASPNIVKGETTTSMSTLEISSDTTKTSVGKSTSTNMSSLQISTKNCDRSTGTNMSSLQISTEPENTKEHQSLLNKTSVERVSGSNNKSFNSVNSFSPVQQEIMTSLLNLLDDRLENSPDNVTRRKRMNAKCENTEFTKSQNTSLSKKSQRKKSVKNDISNENIDNEKRYSRRKTIHCLNTRSMTQKSEKVTKVDQLKSGSSSDSSENEGIKNRRARKLYNPNDSIGEQESSDEKERENKRLKAKKRKPDEGVFIRPNIIPIKPNVFVSLRAKKIIDKHNLNVDSVLNKESSDSDLEPLISSSKKKVKKGKPTEKVANNGDDDEQRSLAEELLAEKLKLEATSPDRERKLEVTLKKCDKTPRRDSERDISKHTNISDEIESKDSKNINQAVKTRKTNIDDLNTPIKPTTPTSDDKKMKTPKNTHKVPRSVASLPKKTNSNIKTTPLSKNISQSVGPSQRRRSVRMSQRVLNKIDLNSSHCSNEKTPSRNRRSSLEFQAKSTLKKKHLKIDKVKKPSIVCTKMHKDDIMVCNQIVRKLGVFITEDEVTSKTTHLVAGEPKRTINMLRAIANGCWILKKEWLFKSLEAGKWLPEEDFEECDFSPIVQKSRMQRQAFGHTYSLDVFRDCGPIFIAKDTIPRCSDLRELVTLCQGKDSPNPRNASIVVGQSIKQDGVICVTVNWILDSITFGKRMPYKKYIFESNRCSIAV